MEKEKKKLDELTKTKLIYSGELLIFAIVFAVLGILILVGVINVWDWKKVAFTWVTLFGGFLLWGDFIWLLCSKKRRKKNSLLDKIFVLPSATFLIGYDLYSLIKGDDSIVSIVMGVIFVYLACVYLFEGVYHWFKTHPGLLEEGTSEAETKNEKEENPSQIGSEMNTEEKEHEEK